VERRTSDARKRGTSDPIRRFFILKVLASNYDGCSSSLSTIHSITEAVQREMKRTLRDIDIKVVVEGLVSKDILEVVSVDSNHAYRLTKGGYEFWKKNREGLALLILME